MPREPRKFSVIDDNAPSPYKSQKFCVYPSSFGEVPEMFKELIPLHFSANVTNAPFLNPEHHDIAEYFTPGLFMSKKDTPASETSQQSSKVTEIKVFTREPNLNNPASVVDDFDRSSTVK